MKNILNYILLILNFILKYDKELLEAYKEIKKDGKLTLADFFTIYELYKNSGLEINEKEEEEVFEAGAFDPMPANEYRKLFISHQRGSECVPNAVRRTTVYNTGIELTEEEFKAFTDGLYKSGKLVAGKGMTFRDCCDEWLKFIEKTKGIKLKYARTKIWGDSYKLMDRLGYAKMIGGYITTKYRTDFMTDDIINDNYTWEEKKRYGHAFMELDKDGAKKHEGNIIENYPNSLKESNIYTNNRILEFIANNYFFAYGYFIFLDENITVNGEKITSKEDFKAKEKIKLDATKKHLDEILDGIDLEKARILASLGLWSGGNPNFKTTRQEASNMDYNIIEYIFKALGREDLLKDLQNGNTNT